MIRDARFNADLVSLGECLVEFSRRERGLYAQTFAGDAFNVLFYAARLGLRTAFVSAVGDDLFTPDLIREIEAEGIDTSHLLRLSGRANGLYFIELDAKGEYTFHFLREHSAARETLLHFDISELAGFIRRSRFFLLTGVTLAVMKGSERLDELIRDVASGTSIVLDTNYRAQLWKSPEEYRRRLEEVLPFVDLFLPTLGDLQQAYPGQEPEELCRRFVEMGVKDIVIKAGAEGCLLRMGETLVHLPPEPVAVVDTTGAGDAFNAGYIAGVVRGAAPQACCVLARQTASAALKVYGALNREFTGDG